MAERLNEQSLQYLINKNIDIETATEAQISDAKAYETCYNWYIEKQKVLPNTADIASSIFIQKYALHDNNGICLEQTPEDLWNRIANVLADEEVVTNPTNKDREFWFKQFRDILTNWKYTPQGSGLYALGNPYVKASASNCFVVDSPSDSLESIFNTARDMARIYAARGGVGTNLTNLRPYGATTNNAAKSSTGAASFMDFYSHVTATIGQSGRRGALMLCMEVRHPDIFRFIQMKQDLDKQWFFDELKDAGIDINDWKYSSIADRLKSTSHANVSVLIDNAFIKAVEEDLDYELWYEFEDNKYPKISNFVKARDIWNKLIEGATNSAEPGIINMELIRQQSPADCYSEETQYNFYYQPTEESIDTIYSFSTTATNPCISGNSYVLTDAGYKQVNNLLNTPWKAVVNGNIYEATAFWETGYKQIYNITLANGATIKATLDHKLQLVDGSWVSVSDSLGKVLKNNVVETYAVSDIFSEDFKTGWLVGSIVGDGYYTTNSGSAVMYWGKSANELAEYANNCLGRKSILTRTENKIKIRTNTINALLNTFIEIDTKELKPAIYSKSKEFISGFLSGLFDADGSVQGTALKGYSVRLSQSKISLIEHCQRLLHMLGVSSKVYKNRRLENDKYWAQGNKVYTSKAQHELIISSSDLLQFSSAVHFMTTYKYNKLNTIIENTNFYSSKTKTKVINIVLSGVEPVYDCTVNDIHCFDLNGIIAHNCGELPLSPGDSCCLGTHNLTAFVINPYKDNAKFDWVEFEKIIKLSTRAQDNIKNIDIRLVPLEINKISAILGRRIGLGCTGLSDALAMLGIRYDSEEAIEASRRIYEVLRDTVYYTSVKLAEEKGAFPAYNKDKEKDHPFLSRLPKNIQNKPRRNIACLTNAPNGSMSILMNNTSSGIEPVFETAEYMRNVKKPGTNDFVQFKVRHQAIEDCINAGGNPDVFVKANDVSGEMRIKLQAAIQEYIDHAISVTTNLPAGTTQEHVGNLYLQAFKAGCKGFTVYVDGCRTGVLNTIKEEPKVHKITERPKTTNIDIHKVKYKEKSWCVLVGRTSSGPIEVFAGIEEDTPLPNKYKRAELTKKSRGHYSLTIYLSDDEENDIIKIGNIGARFPLPEGMALTRLISMSLRNGVPVSEICEQLTKSSNSMFDYPAVLNRVLKQYIPEAELIAKEKAKGEVCPDCGSELIIKRESGCILKQCSSCSYINSKCG